MRYLVELHLEVEARDVQHARHLAEQARRRLIWGKLARVYVRSFLVAVREQVNAPAK